MAVNALLNENYPDIFTGYIMRSAEYALERVQQATTSLPTDSQVLGMHTLGFTLKLPQAWPITRSLLLAMAPKMEQAGYRDEWIVYLESGIEQSQEQGNLETEAELRFQLGVLYEQLTNYDEAYRQLEFSAMHFEQVENSHYQARALNSLAYIARRQRRFGKAKKLVETALELLVEEKSELARSYVVLGSIAFDQHNWPETYDFFSKSLVLWEETNNLRMIAWGLTNLGVVLWKTERYENAITHYKKAINKFETVKDPVHLALARMNLGNVYMELDRLELALELYLLAQPIFHKTQDKLRLAMLNNNKGMAYQKLEQWNKAKQAYRSGIELWLQLNNIKSLVNSMDNLGTVYLEEQLYDKAIATFQDALNWLAQIKNDPSYDFLFDMVTTHLDKAKKL